MSQVLAFSREEVAAPSAPCPVAEGAIANLLEGRDLDRSSARSLFAQIVDGSLSEPLMAAAFVALRVKGESADELVGAAEALRAAARPFPSPTGLFADSCGTGGDYSGSINVSTAAAIVLAIGAFYELIEWWVAVLATPNLGDKFLGTQGDIWDTQWDMFLALVGVAITLSIFSKRHDRELGV